jgi:hypothetical protein
MAAGRGQQFAALKPAARAASVMVQSGVSANTRAKASARAVKPKSPAFCARAPSRCSSIGYRIGHDPTANFHGYLCIGNNHLIRAIEIAIRSGFRDGDPKLTVIRHWVRNLRTIGTKARCQPNAASQAAPPALLLRTQCGHERFHVPIKFANYLNLLVPATGFEPVTP